MKRKLIVILFCFVITLVLGNLNISARIINENLCEREDIEVTWSGTWGVAGTEGTNNPGTHLIDGDYSNKWGSNDIYLTKEEWVQFTFSEPVTIHSFHVYQEISGNYTNIKQFTFQILNENDEWEIVYTSPEFDDFWSDHDDDFDEPITCTSIRFHCDDSQAAPGLHTEPEKCAIELSEVELFYAKEVEDTPSPEPTDTPEPTQTPQNTQAAGDSNGDKGNSNLPAIIGGVIAVVVVVVVVVVLAKATKKRS